MARASGKTHDLATATAGTDSMYAGTAVMSADGNRVGSDHSRVTSGFGAKQMFSIDEDDAIDPKRS
jgi:hypothetical protein